NGTQVSLSWADNSGNETGFNLYKSTDGTNFTLLTTAGAAVASTRCTGAARGPTYAFQVSAYNATGEPAASNTATATTPAAPAPPPRRGTPTPHAHAPPLRIPGRHPPPPSARPRRRPPPRPVPSPRPCEPTAPRSA